MISAASARACSNRSSATSDLAERDLGAIDEMRVAGLSLQTQALFEAGARLLVFSGEEMAHPSPFERLGDLRDRADLAPHLQGLLHHRRRRRVVAAQRVKIGGCPERRARRVFRAGVAGDAASAGVRCSRPSSR